MILVKIILFLFKDKTIYIIKSNRYNNNDIKKRAIRNYKKK